MLNVALITLGCAKNLVDSEVMSGYLAEAGYSFVLDPEKADVLIINTCGFIQPARAEAVQEIRRAVALKKKDPGKRIIAVGCYVERDEDSLRRAYPEVDVWMGVKDFHNIVQFIEGKPSKPTTGCFLYDHTSPRLISTPPAWAYIKISEGCSHECSFCAIPLIKGSYRSRDIRSILYEAEALVSNGIKEINLISQDSTYYGRDMGLQDGLTQLLGKLIDIQGLEWVRILYGYPEEVNDSLLEIMQEEKICSYLDLPFQHADPRIIKAMKRSMDRDRALVLLKKIRKLLPHVALRTSLVVGFPGEGKTEFENLKVFVKEARFDHLGVFVYSREHGTDCYDLGDPVKDKVKERRKDQILDIQADISYEKNSKQLNKRLEVLIEGTWKQDPGQVIGRARFQAPEVDGVVFLDTPPSLLRVVNTVQKVEITGHDIYDLYGYIL